MDFTDGCAEILALHITTDGYFSLSEEDPAFQASIDYAHDNGFYASIWGSNIDYGSDYDGTIEIDLSAGLAGETEMGIGWDVGAVTQQLKNELQNRLEEKLGLKPAEEGASAPAAKPRDALKGLLKGLLK